MSTNQLVATTNTKISMRVLSRVGVSTQFSLGSITSARARKGLLEPSVWQISLKPDVCQSIC